MPKAAKLKTDLGDLSDALFSDAIITIFNLMTLNSGLFTGVPIVMGAIGPLPVGSFGDFINRFNTIRLAPAYTGQTVDTAAARKNMQKAVTKDGNWLNTFCGGDLTLLTKTGYPLQKENEAQGVLDETVLDITSLTIVNKMEFLISFVKGANIRYGIMWTESTNLELDPSKWNHYFYAGHRDGEIPGFIQGKTYKFSSFAMGTDLQLAYSAVITVIAL